MKILESQSATLTNYEVLAHIQSLSARASKASLDSTPPLKAANYETVMKELSTHLSPAPFDFTTPRPPPYYSQYSPQKIQTLVSELAPYKLTKTEVLMIINIRPDSSGVLDPIVEECEQRYSEEEQERILQIIGDVLGRVDDDDGVGVNGENGEDVNGYHGHENGDDVDVDMDQSNGVGHGRRGREEMCVEVDIDLGR